MHFIFMPYGKRDEVELLLRDMEAQKHFLKFKEGGGRWIQAQIRALPFGVYEYIAPQDDADTILHTLDFDGNRYGLSGLVLAFLRSFIKCEKIPKYKKDKYYLWVKDNVNIISLGVRYDKLDFYDDLLKKTHEAI